MDPWVSRYLWHGWYGSMDIHDQFQQCVKEVVKSKAITNPCRYRRKHTNQDLVAFRSFLSTSLLPGQLPGRRLPSHLANCMPASIRVGREETGHASASGQVAERPGLQVDLEVTSHESWVCSIFDASLATAHRPIDTQIISKKLLDTTKC